MKSKILLIPALLLGVGVLGGTAVAMANSKVATVARADASSPYAINDAMYEAAFFEQYNDVANCIDTEDYSYANDKPIGKNTIGGHLYGTYGNSASLKQTKYETNLMGVNETLQWRFSGLNVKGKSGPNRLYIQLENNSSNWNICKASSFPQETSPDEYALGQLVTAAGKAKGASMVSTTAITNIQDMTFYWRSSYSTKVLICYQLDGETEWKVFHTINMDETTEKILGNYSGTRGWDTYGYTTFNSSSWTTKELYGATAKIAFVCTEAPTESGSFPLSAVLINANNAAVRYLNMLSYQDHVCSDNGTDMQFNLNKGQSDKAHNQDMFQMITERADGNFLANYALAGTKSSETTTLGLYNHLVASIPALGTAKVASSNFFQQLVVNNNTLPIVIGGVLVVAGAIAAGVVLSLRKKKHN